SATQQTSAALTQIEKGAKLAEKNGKTADDQVQGINASLKESRASIEALISGVSNALKGTQASVNTAGRLEGLGRKIEKIVNAIALTAVQISMLAVSGL